MKKLLLALSFLTLASCASTSPLPEEKGTVCVPPKAGEELSQCWSARMWVDPTRFHYLRPWQERSLGDMPDLP